MAEALTAHGVDVTQMEQLPEILPEAIQMATQAWDRQAGLVRSP